jgi:hypothetical protein
MCALWKTYMNSHNLIIASECYRFIYLVTELSFVVGQ